MYGNTSFPIAIHAMTSVAALTERWHEECATAPVIAKSIDTHEVIVRKVLGSLSKKGLILAKRGVGGGYVLARPSQDITLADIFTALNDELPFALHPKNGNPHCPVSRSIKPLLEPIIQGLHEKIIEELRKTTLHDIVYQMK